MLGDVPDEVFSPFRADDDRAIARSIGWKCINNDVFDRHFAFTGTTVVWIPFAWRCPRVVVPLVKLVLVGHCLSGIVIFVVAVHHVFDEAILRVPETFQLHSMAARRTLQGIFTISFEEQKLKRFSRQYPVSARICFLFRWYKQLDFSPHLFVADVAMEAVVSDALEAFREDMLDHSTLN